MFVRVSIERPLRAAVRWVATALVVGLVANVMWAPPLLAATDSPGVVLPAGKSVPLSPVKARKPPIQNLPYWHRGVPQWPAGGTATVAVDIASSGAARAVPKAGAAGVARAGGLPIAVRAPGGEGANARAGSAAVKPAGPASVKVAVADRAVTDAAGVRGVLFTLARADGQPGTAKVALDLDYSQFTNAYGADYGGRLRLVRLPQCALTTPDRRECRVQTPVAGSSNVRASQVVSIDGLEIPEAAPSQAFAAQAGGKDTVTADPGRLPALSGRRSGSGKTGTPITPASPAGSGIFALTASASSDAGDYSHTSLAPTYSWGAGVQGGDFTYSIPLAVPPSLGGPSPELALGYSSGSVDGKTTSTNNQPSWVGEGWDLQTGYIEQSYKPCAEDGQATGDLCWFSDHLMTMVFAGRATRLIKDETTGEWRGESDDGSRIEQLTSQDLIDHGDDALGRYWKVTTVDGTQYFFGLNKRYATDTQRTNASQRVLVYGNDPGEPCHNDEHDYWSGCYLTYRWNLDYVVDPRGNSMTYFFTGYGGQYGNWNGTDVHDYDLVEYVDHIEYGTRAGSEATTTAPMKVVFERENRCTDTDCEVYPDAPTDTYCPLDATSCDEQTPTFWSPFRLSTVETEVWNPATSAYRPVDRWTLTPEYPDPGNGDDPSLWMTHLSHSGFAADGTELAMPMMDFNGSLMANHVLGAPGTDMNHWRLSGILNGAGGWTEVTYSPLECTSAIVNTITKKNNPYRCFPDGGSTMWFHKYVVDAVTEHDDTGGSPDETWFYDYNTDGSNSAALWQFDNAEAADLSVRTWNNFAGYSTVIVTHGPPAGVAEVTRKLFHRGMDGDYLGSGAGPRYGTIQDSSGILALDQFPLRGFLREEQTLDSAGSVVAKTLHGPTLNGEGTAHRSDTWPGGHATAYLLREYLTTTATWVAASSSWRTTQVERGFDDYGLLELSKDHGDLDVGNDDTCTTNSYARNTTKYLISYLSQRITTDCAASPSGANFLSGSQTQYDGGAVGAAPTKGLATRTNALASVSGTTLTWAQSTRTGYDNNNYGRVTDRYDALDRHTTTAYLPATGGPLTKTTVTNPAGHVVATTLDGARGLPTGIVDANNKVTTMQYDPLGRLRKVFKPHTSGPTTTLPDLEFTYALNNDGPTVVSSKRLGPNGNVIVSFELYDGRLRPRQTQSPAAQANGGWLITDTAYNERGLTAKTSVFWNNSAPAGVALYNFADADVQNQHRYTYDERARQTADAQYAGNVLKWRTTTGYDGDRSWTIPPAGGTTTMAITNAQGKTTALRQYLSGSPPTGGTYQTTAYAYDRLQQLTAVTDPAGSQWTIVRDLRGRVTSTTDPDKGGQSATFDNAGQILTATDARGVTLAYSYDSLGRKTGVFDGSASGFKRAGWVYDTVAKGQLTSSSRYHNSTDTYTTTVTGYNDQYQPLGVSVTIPVVTGQPAGTYTVNTAYKVDGSLASTGFPAAGGLAAETVTNAYDNSGRLLTVTGADSYVSATSYYNFGPVFQRLLGSGTKKVRQTTLMDEATGRLTSNATQTQNQTNTANWDEKLTETYGYDNAGNVKSIKETAAGATVSNQCFTYDTLRELKESWTTTAATCQATPTQSIVGGPDSYWNSYTYSNTGNRATDIKHATTGNITRTYTYPTTGQRHTLTSVAITGAATGTDSFGYDPAGNTTTRNLTGKPGQTLTWDNEGHLATVVDSGGTTSYIYDANGNRLVRKDPAGVTVYLPGSELRTAGSTTTCTRYYKAGESTVGSRKSTGGLTWLSSDHHQTGQLSIDSATLATTRRKLDPFGNPRGPQPAWPNGKGFVGGTVDNTELTHLGAREYDPATGRFLSDDAVTDLNDPQQANGYAYANNTPITLADPDGLDPGGRCDLAGMCSSQVATCVGIGYDSPACKGVWQRPVSWGDVNRRDNERLEDEKNRARDCRRFGECGPQQPGPGQTGQPDTHGDHGKKPKELSLFEKIMVNSMAFTLHVVLQTACMGFLAAAIPGAGAVAGGAVCGGVAGAFAEGAKYLMTVALTGEHFDVGHFLAEIAIGAVSGAAAGAMFGALQNHLVDIFKSSHVLGKAFSKYMDAKDLATLRTPAPHVPVHEFTESAEVAYQATTATAGGLWHLQ